MKTETNGEVHVPQALLTTPELTPAAKVVWIALRHQQGADWALPPTLLARRIGLARSTVYEGLAQLERTGWCGHSGKGATKGMAMPLDLLTDATVRPQGRLLYCLLQAMPGTKGSKGEARYAALSERSGVHVKTVKRSMAELAAAGWLTASQVNQKAPVCFALCNPVVARGLRQIAAVDRRLAKAEYLGEALMREFLSQLIDSDDHQDDAAPQYLENPLTKERMQFDRYYSGGVAFEFNGAQHYAATEFYSQEEVDAQRARDLMKRGICDERRIALVVIHPEDLSLEAMREKIGNLLPLRDLTGLEPVIRHLEARSRSYRKAARRATQRDAEKAARNAAARTPRAEGAERAERDVPAAASPGG